MYYTKNLRLWIIQINEVVSIGYLEKNHNGEFLKELHGSKMEGPGIKGRPQSHGLKGWKYA